MALITNITSREHAGNQPFRDWNCMHYNKCLDQAAKVNGLLDCDGCDSSVPREHLDLYDIELGEMAVDIVSKIGDAIDLVILDLSMPGMDGRTTFNIIHKSYPKIPVLLSSGYSLEGDGSELLQKGCYSFIRKPVNIHELSQKIDLAFSMDVASSQEEYIPS